MKQRPTDVTTATANVHFEADLVTQHHLRLVAQHLVIDLVALRSYKIEATRDVAFGRCRVERKLVGGVVAQRHTWQRGTEGMVQCCVAVQDETTVGQVQ
ncbi:hypothetical protein D3C71_1625820 [compost metagenome]